MGPGVAGGPTAAAVVAASEGKAKKYGLLGLLGVIRMTDPDLNTLALGSDLTTVGLNLDSAEVKKVENVENFSEGVAKNVSFVRENRVENRGFGRSVFD